MTLMRCVILCSVFFSYAWSFQCPVHERKFEQRLLEPVCQCDAGYSRQGGICSPCPAGTFKEYAGDSAETNGACFITTGSKGCCKCNINTNTLNVGAFYAGNKQQQPLHNMGPCGRPGEVPMPGAVLNTHLETIRAQADSNKTHTGQ